MVLIATAMVLIVLAQSQAGPIATAVALLEVVEEYCQRPAADPVERTRLLSLLQDYDVGGLASPISPTLNAMYTEFLGEARRDRTRFCAAAPDIAARAGFKDLFEP
jgi:hypothetical protein